MTAKPPQTDSPEKPPTQAHRMPEGSTFYERILPALLLLLGVVMAGLILFALGVILRVIPWV